MRIITLYLLQVSNLVYSDYETWAEIASSSDRGGHCDCVFSPILLEVVLSNFMKLI